MVEIDESYYRAEPEEQLAQPLSDVTRRDRTALLAANVVLFAAVQGGILPTSINAFGIEATHLRTGPVLLLLHGVVVYFLSAFCLYAWSDFRVWRLRLVWLKQRREKPYKDFFQPSNVERLANEHLQKSGSSTSREEILQAFREGLESTRPEIETSFASSWSKHVRPFRYRLYFDIWLPIVITVLNVAAALWQIVR